MPAPDFICIGAQKAGTTWLHRQLSQHPQIWLPALKELHYFDRPHIRRYANHLFSRSTMGRLSRTLMWQPIKPQYSLGWMMRYLWGRRTDAHYFSLFEPQAGQLCGELTPAYARLGEEDIARIKALVADCKLIYLLRNPVDRIWSQIQMFQRKKKVHENSTLMEVFQSEEGFMLDSSRYMANLARWEKAYGPDQLFIGFFEQIHEAPTQLLKEVYHFLGVDDSDDRIPSNLKAKHNPGGAYAEIPVAFERMLTQQLLPEMEALHARFQNAYTQQWLNRAEACLAANPEF